MSLLSNLLKDHKDEIIDNIFNEELKGKVVKAINDNIDVPFISEATEGKIIDAMYSSIEDVVKNVIKEQL